MICKKLTEDHNPRIDWCPFCRIAELEAERDAAFNKGMERAAEIADGLYDKSNTVWSARNAAEAIRKEIDK